MPLGGISLGPCAPIADVAFFERPPFNRPSVSPGEIIISDRHKPSRSQRLTGMAADVSSATGNEDIQLFWPPNNPLRQDQTNVGLGGRK